MLAASVTAVLQVVIIVLMSMSSSRSPMSGANFTPNCEPHLGPSASQIQTLVMTGLAFSRSSDELERSSN